MWLQWLCICRSFIVHCVKILRLYMEGLPLCSLEVPNFKAWWFVVVVCGRQEFSEGTKKEVIGGREKGQRREL